MQVKELFEPYLEYMRRIGRSPQTVYIHRKFLEGAASHTSHNLHNKDISELRATDDSYLIESGKKHGELDGGRRAVIVWRQFLKWVDRSGYGVPFHWQDLHVPTEIQNNHRTILKGERLEWFLGLFDIKTEGGLRMRTLLEMILGGSGLRIAEATNVRLKDIDWEEKTIKVTNAKTKDREIVCICDRAIYWIKRYLSKRTHKDSEFLFVSLTGKQWDDDDARDRLLEYRKKFKIREKITFHTFRRALATMLIEAGVDINVVRSILRHKSARTTLKYYVVEDQERARTICLDTLNSGKVLSNMDSSQLPLLTR